MNCFYDIAKKVINSLTDKGCQKAQCKVEETEKQEFNVDGSEFSLYRTTFDNKLYMTAFKDNKKGKININRLDDKSISKAVLNCLEVVESSSEDKAHVIAPHIGKRQFSRGIINPDLELFFEKCKELVNDIKKRHPKIMMEQLIFSHNKLKSLYLDTNDNEYELTEGFYEIGLMFSAHDGEKSTSFFGTGVLIDKLDKPFIELGSIEKNLTDVENQLNTVPLNGKTEGTVIITPNCLPAILLSAIENFAGDNTILNGTSIWRDKINSKVADERISISFLPNDERIVNGDCYTDDGFISEDFDLIKDGILKSFYISMYVANKTGFERSKNKSYNLVVKNGNKNIGDIIKNVKKGIIVGRFSGGQPSKNGDFSGVAKNSFLVKDGQIKGAVNEVMISGNLSDLLNNVVDISKEVVEYGEMVLPYIAFKNVIISGK
ncbi:TldD/PmbA family protein [Sedimentibacter sp. zth1]|uniref:TldD/PmbA family protein n=1 Tax=Sedimentibacter sp. zth1 TaxID=2816908 RepID=UPI001A914F0A|nr:metallopeptidase TldD-related protein [Sedimentibacter sp. zth1]QSX07087.1 TldD/PmbA family protein [Sedimentibacter sp. zth1]